jgi:hypothetical protein
LEISAEVNKEADRYVFSLERPLQAGSNKTFVDHSPVSKIFVFSEELAREVFGDDFELAKITIMLSDPEAREQVRHIGYKSRINIKRDPSDMDYVVIMPFKFKGDVCVWPYSQHIVNSSAKAIDQSIHPERIFSFIKDDLVNNEDFPIEIHKCEKEIVPVGVDEMCILGDNSVHACAKSNMYVDTIRVHLYVTRKVKKGPVNIPIVLDAAAWDLTRKGSASVNIIYKNIETQEEYNKHKESKKNDRPSTEASSIKTVKSPESPPALPPASSAKSPASSPALSPVLPVSSSNAPKISSTKTAKVKDMKTNNPVETRMKRKAMLVTTIMPETQSLSSQTSQACLAGASSEPRKVGRPRKKRNHNI